MNVTKLWGYIPASLRTQLLDNIVEAIAEQTEKFDPKIAKHIRKLSSQAVFNEAFQKAIENAEKRFIGEYSEEDEDIVKAIQDTPTIWESKTIQKVLLKMIRRPGAYLIDEREELAQHFEDILPQRINRKRVDKAIIYFLRCIVEELWTLPGAKEIRDVYTLQFQRITAEALHEQVMLSRKQIETTALLGKEVQQALLQFTVLAEQHFLPLISVAGELSPPRPYQNLIPKNYSQFVGREEEINKLLKFLSPEYGLNIITVDGIGGVGKTSLVLEVAYRCLEASKEKIEGKDSNVPTFEAIIFTSAKQDTLIAGGILSRHQAQRTLQDIFHEISRTLNRPDILRATPAEQFQKVHTNLARQRTLLIIDNLETIEDKQGILSFLYELSANTKVIITTRERQSITPIRLTELPEIEGISLIRQKVNEMDIYLTEDMEKALYQVTGGIPAAIIYAIGQIASGYTVQTVFERIKSATGDVARFCFQGSVEPLRGTSAHQLLMTIAMFPKNPVRNAIADVAGYLTDPITVEESLVRLQRLSLVTQIEERYCLLPLTREYALAELATYPNFEIVARERWIKWYLQFVQKYGGEPRAGGWHIYYEQLETEWENIQEVLKWCAAQEQYSDFKILWDRIMSYTRIYGYWNNRLVWIEWIINAAKKRGDFSTLVKHLLEKGWTLQQIGQIEESKTVYEQAWELHENTKDFTVLSELARRIAEMKAIEKNYTEALQWLDKSEWFDKSGQSENEIQTEEVKKRQYIRILYRRARVFEEIGDYAQAKTCLENMLRETEAIDWQYFAVWAKRVLADINMREGDLDKSEQLLKSGFSITERSNDKLGIVGYKRSFARLSQLRGDKEGMCRWAKRALDDYERLGAIKYADEMRGLIESIAC